MKKKFTFKFMLLLCALVVGISSVWAEKVTYQHVFNAKPSTGNNVTLSSVNWNITATNLGGYNSGNYAGVQLGSSKSNGSITLTSFSAWGEPNGTYHDKTKITEVRLWLNLGGTSVTPSVSIGGVDAVSDGTEVVKNSSAGTDWTKTTKVTFTPASSGESGVVVINVETVKAGYICCVEIDCEEPSSTLLNNDMALTEAPISLSFDFYDNYSAQQISYTTSSTGAVTVDASEYITATVNESTKIITIEPVKKTSGAQTITVRQAADDTYKAGSTTFTVTITDSTPVSWVETSLANLTSGDVFVIVGNNGSNYAMTNNNGTSNPPAASAVTIEKVNNINKITSDVDDNIQWNLVITDGGYVFYPAGDASKWLYCTNTNNGVRVGTGDAKHFTIDSDYLYMTETSDNRYIGIYNSQDWRCYTSINSNIENQTFAFYKKVYDNTSSYNTNITGCGTGTDNNDGYYLIASPVISVNPTTGNFLTNSYDLYYFDQSSEGSEWKNYKANSFNLYTGKGYLYANSDNVELTFTGQPYNGNGVVGLKYDNENTPYFKGWNLIGNPYSTTAYLPKEYAFYKMKEDHTELEAVTNAPISAMEGVFVKVNAVNQTVTFSTTAPAKGWTAGSKVVINVADNKGNFIDRAIVRFDEGNTLPKFMLNDKNAKVYIPREDDDYAVVISDGKDNMPVKFKPATTGKYTLTIDTEGIDMNYLHLIDRFTGEDIDLLVDNTYSFVGSQIDNDSRFILSFTAKGYSVTSDEPFAYQSGTDIIVDGNGELQIFDVTGRKVSTMNIIGVETIHGLAQGVYIFRVIGETLRTQKIVVR